MSVTPSDLAQRAPLGDTRPGRISPTRPVPPDIERPEYLFHSGPEVVTADEVKSPETIEKIRRAGTLAADALAAVGRAVRPGVTTDELDAIGHDYLVSHGAYPSCLGYMGFPKSLCTSINEVICHGIPDDRPLAEGDIVNVDITAYLDGVHGDTCAMFAVGEIDPESAQLIDVTRKALERGIRAVRPGRPLNVIGRVISAYAKRFSYGVVRDFTGHGVGEAFHSGLIVPHYDTPSADTIFTEGMVFTIEPMLTLGGIAWNQWDDGWTVVTADRSRTAQFEHTIVVTAEGAEILTLPSSHSVVSDN
ncbi:type I methionyl aminopeptidase [Nanchangia anserum]|uniref:Methionine aminopeptidase n=1 Tax=Nanchangia anserum TaxID=2692125 RepID=A0A8I0GB71_9ACTO|nr:type I methionyl aminopeptidase [Nanchangia anserum]MBD3688960.1 type I methionyl aminopeptidase [Nanchangia anserum]QOX81217.1 type I methionyl aminopeptidase [Nanchangia anserum]